MKKSTWIIGMVILLTRSVGSQVIFEAPLSARNANYKIDVSLDVDTKQIRGKQVLTWRNITRNPTRELQFHLYMNAFKNNRSTHILEGGGQAKKLDKEKAWGWIDVDRLRIADGTDLTDRMEFYQPDDDNEHDQTVLRVPLTRAVRPGQEIRLEIEFTTQLPWVFRRNGFYKDFFFAAQWFPKIGVLEDEGWNCHQFHANTEFFSDYGVYEVNITLPAKFIVGGTGTLQNGEENNDLKTHSFRAEDVHDFAWTTWPDFQIARETHRGVEIIHLYEKDHTCTVERTMQAMKYTLEYLTDWLGEYPYPNITILHPPTHCFAVGGMEYPMFVTGGAFWNIPEGFRITEMVTVHEFAHNWWYGMIGNNEFEEAWLDEGINSYAEARIMDHYYGKKASMIDVMGIRMGELDISRGSYIGLTRWDRTLREAWTYIGGGYGTLSYQKPTLMLRTLENMLGQETMDRIMRTFFQRWKFQHPTTQDFIDVVQEITGENYDWYFDQILKSALELDFRVASARSKEEKKRKGVFDEGEGKITLTNSDDNDDGKLYRTVVKIQRKGEVVIPVDVLMVFENGDSVKQVWDGKDRWMKYEFLKPTKLLWTSVDPDRKLVLDSNFANNSRTVKQQKKAVNYLSTRFLYWFESLFHLIGFFG
jgi:hypothetical protein